MLATAWLTRPMAAAIARPVVIDCEP
jgi:hypothetical protein